jgi:hypothetical protein
MPCAEKEIVAAPMASTCASEPLNPLIPRVGYTASQPISLLDTAKTSRIDIEIDSDDEDETCSSRDRCTKPQTTGLTRGTPVPPPFMQPPANAFFTSSSSTGTAKTPIWGTSVSEKSPTGADPFGSSAKQRSSIFEASKSKRSSGKRDGELPSQQCITTRELDLTCPPPYGDPVCSASGILDLPRCFTVDALQNAPSESAAQASSPSTQQSSAANQKTENDVREAKHSVMQTLYDLVLGSLNLDLVGSQEQIQTASPSYSHTGENVNGLARGCSNGSCGGEQEEHPWRMWFHESPQVSPQSPTTRQPDEHHNESWESRPSKPQEQCMTTTVTDDVLSFWAVDPKMQSLATEGPLVQNSLLTSSFPTIRPKAEQARQRKRIARTAAVAADDAEL